MCSIYLSGCEEPLWHFLEKNLVFKEVHTILSGHAWELEKKWKVIWFKNKEWLLYWWKLWRMDLHFRFFPIIFQSATRDNKRAIKTWPNRLFCYFSWCLKDQNSCKIPDKKVALTRLLPRTLDANLLCLELICLRIEIPHEHELRIQYSWTKLNCQSLSEMRALRVFLHYHGQGRLVHRVLIHALLSEPLAALGCGYNVSFHWLDAAEGCT